ncbi:hypothetical protein K505DRAFT_342471 [Melanomma pulvis-pyrius CBS 109.77]|uniref:Uncharacterized protein n=1 Tax=Melanomma pulvis-pyrius CBS 109.77 TaxID=1314802 RepID=A0A6A6WVP2_9PLEO|nr:hypothetical protein K505DRAFT_342471 [Melanomma pulvis-pyrius CBS 109.77]
MASNNNPTLPDRDQLRTPLVTSTGAKNLKPDRSHHSHPITIGGGVQPLAADVDGQTNINTALKMSSVSRVDTLNGLRPSNEILECRRNSNGEWMRATDSIGGNLSSRRPTSLFDMDTAASQACDSTPQILDTQFFSQPKPKLEGSKGEESLISVPSLTRRGRGHRRNFIPVSTQNVLQLVELPQNVDINADHDQSSQTSILGGNAPGPTVDDRIMKWNAFGTIGLSTSPPKEDFDVIPYDNRGPMLAAELYSSARDDLPELINDEATWNLASFNMAGKQKLDDHIMGGPDDKISVIDFAEVMPS